MHWTWSTSTSCSNCKSIFCRTDSNITYSPSQPTATLSWKSILGYIRVWQCFTLQWMQRENRTGSKQESATTTRWHCSSTQGVCYLPKFPDWILWAIKRCAQCILPPMEDMHSFPFLRFSSNKPYQGKVRGASEVSDWTLHSLSNRVRSTVLVNPFYWHVAYIQLYSSQFLIYRRRHPLYLSLVCLVHVLNTGGGVGGARLYS